MLSAKLRMEVQTIAFAGMIRRVSTCARNFEKGIAPSLASANVNLAPAAANGTLPNMTRRKRSQTV